MSKVVFLDPIDHISGKIAKKTRTVYCYRNESDKRYTQLRGKRTTPYKASELARFDKFAAVSRAVHNVYTNPQLLNTAQSEFTAQTTYKKLRNYLWHREWENYQG